MRLRSFIKSYRAPITLTLIYILIANVLTLALPWGIKIIVDDVLVRRDIRLLNMVVLGLLGILLLRSAFNFLYKMTSNITGERIVCDLREKIYWHTQKLSLTSIKKITPAQILTRVVGDVESVRRFIFGDVIDFLYALLSMGFIAFLLLWINPRLTLVALVTLPLFALCYFRLISHLKTGHRFLRDTHGKLTARIHEVLNGMAVVRVFNAQDYEKDYFSRQQKAILQMANKTHRLNVGLWVGIDIFTSLGIIGVLWIGGLDVLSQRMTAGELIAFYSYLGMLFGPIIRLVVINSSYQEASAALGRISEIIKIEDEVRESPTPLILPLTRGYVEFKNVSFGYSKDKDVLKGINFSVNEGEVIGVVGASGAGKTTLINLLVRFFDPKEGEIRIDGYLLRKLDLKSYRRQLAVVLQDDYLFSGTIQENICYGSFESTPAQMKEAAHIAQAYGFIDQFQDGYMTQVGERGLQLSSGQRQRIAIARAIMRRPSILILDEATSSVDALTENKIQKGISRHLEGTTIFIVAHRFSTIMEADKIMVLEKGNIVEMGPHNYLLKKQGFYSRLYYEQFKDDSESLLVEM